MAGSPSSTSDVILYFLAIFIPPASVFYKRQCGPDFWINILLFILGWIPGVLHAWWIITKYQTPEHSNHNSTSRVYPSAQSTDYTPIPPK